MSIVQMQIDTRQLTGTLDRSKEQLIPGHDSEYWLEFHLTFYRFAEQLCGGNVLDIGCGYGYGKPSGSDSGSCHWNRLSCSSNRVRQSELPARKPHLRTT